MENQTQIDIFIGLAILSLVCLALMVVVFFNTYRRKMLEKEAKIKTMELETQLEIFRSATEAEERQKEKIAKNLHDGIIPILSTIERSLDKNIKDFGGPNFDIERLEQDLKHLEEVGMNIRGISHDLAPQSLLLVGLIQALHAYIIQIGNSNEHSADFENLTSYQRSVPFSENEQINIYRICLELINNLSKHAKFTYLKMIVEKNGNNLDIVFMHNGKGVTNEEIEKISETSTGLGLKSLKSRALLLGAKYDYIIEDSTSSITLTIPIRI